MRACIYGAGAMGTVLGAFVARSGRQIDLVTRNAAHVAQLNAGGAEIAFATGGGFNQRVTALAPGDMQGKYDIIFLMTKQRQNAQIVEFLLHFLADDGVICTTQNGLPEYSVAAVAGEGRTLGCAISWGASYVAPGRVQLTSDPAAMTLALGSPFGSNDKIDSVKSYLECAGRVETPPNFAGARWSKLIVNSAFSSLSAITSLTFGQIAKARDSRRLAQMLLKEGIDTAMACGVTPAKIQGHDLVKLLNYNSAIKRAVSFALIPIAMKRHSHLVSGMYYDLAAGRKCDMDLVAGQIALHAQRAGIDVPATRGVLELCARIEGGRMDISPRNIAVLADMLKP